MARPRGRHAPGSLGNALITRAEQLVIDNKTIGTVKNVCEGVEVTSETLTHECLADGVREGTCPAGPDNETCRCSAKVFK